MRVEQRGNDVLHDDHHADPGDEAVAAEKHEMRRPHRQQHGHADEAELDRDRENLIVGLTGATLAAPVSPILAR
jgi:hypothetical protein